MVLKKHLILTGFMGTGKTSVAKILSRRLGVDMIDTDEEIVRKTGKTIPEIFAMPLHLAGGEKGFRDIESDVIKEVTARRPYAVISAGGGAVLRRENREAFRNNGIIINLRASPRTIYERLGSSADESRKRPLLSDYYGKNKDDLDSAAYNRIKELLDQRAEFYADCDFSVDTDNLSPEEAADFIIKKISSL